jgi:hypothetical protein
MLNSEITKLDYMISVMESYKEGKEIQGKTSGDTVWHDIDNPIWDWSTITYRAKPLKLDIIKTDEDLYASRELIERKIKELIKIENTCRTNLLSYAFKKLLNDIFGDNNEN